MEAVATERRLAAILAADVVGYSRLVEKDEAGTLAALRKLRAEVIDPLIARYKGRIVKLMGDGAIVEFGSVVDAVSSVWAATLSFCSATAHGRARRQVFGDRPPLATGAQDVHQPVDSLTKVHRALVPPRLAGGTHGAISAHSASVRSEG